uniref:Ig-like domain-containing protein n=1 Tax=Astyanax mexicanus TaxID=7994 RepID=A0A3B1IBR0_ASTMX
MSNHVRCSVCRCQSSLYLQIHDQQTRPYFVAFTTGNMITLLYTFWLFVTVKTSTFDLQVQTQNIGESVTIKCDQIQDRQYSLAWFKQSFGKLPQLVVRASDSGERFGPTFDQRFRVSSNEGRFDLNIINTMEEDTGTYFCMRVKDNVADFGTGTLLLFSGETSQMRTLTEMDVKSGKSVTLQCSVQTLHCSEDHSVYWFRHESGESDPGIIFTHGNRSDQCKKSSETVSPTQSCIYKLPKNNLSLSDAGTYYCAVAACGEILFGNGTKLHVKGWTCDPGLSYQLDFKPLLLNVIYFFFIISESNVWIVAALSLFSVISVIVIAEDTDAVNYAALNFAKKPPPSRTPRTKQTQDIYSQVRVR